MQLKTGKGLLAKPSQGNSSNLEQAELSRLSLIREGLNQYDLSQDAQDVLMASWREGTSKQYQTYHSRWQHYCKDRNNFGSDSLCSVYYISLITSGNKNVYTVESEK